MADLKISELSSLLGSDVDPNNDLLAIVDFSSLETKKITVAEIIQALGLDQPLVQKLNVTDTSFTLTDIFTFPAAALSFALANELTWSLRVPSNWDTSQDPTVQAIGFTTGAGTAENYVFEYGISAFSNGDTLDATDDETINFTELAPDAADELFYTSQQTIDSATINLAANDLMKITFRRLGNDLSDDRGGNFNLLYLLLTWPRTGLGIH